MTRVCATQALEARAAKYQVLDFAMLFWAFNKCSIRKSVDGMMT
jgi:hypothetical protein